MEVKVTKKITKRQIADTLKHYTAKYGSISNLSQKVSITKCASLDLMNDLIIWKNLREGAELKEEIIFKGSEIFDTLSPKRIELMEFLSNNEVSSIRELAELLHRNYKNTYDDLNALVAYDLITLLPSGRRRRPVCSVTSVVTSFEA